MLILCYLLVLTQGLRRPWSMPGSEKGEHCRNVGMWLGGGRLGCATSCSTVLHLFLVFQLHPQWPEHCSGGSKGQPHLRIRGKIWSWVLLVSSSIHSSSTVCHFLSIHSILETQQQFCRTLQVASTHSVRLVKCSNRPAIAILSVNSYIHWPLQSYQTWTTFSIAQYI